MSHITRNLLTLLIGSVLLVGSPALAGDLLLQSGERQNTLLELYTSQGCSSCPPAERWLGSLQQDPRLWKSLIPVAFHVDYWDYIGWKDELARPAFSERQRRYSRENGLSTVYTPGFVVNGREWRRWYGLRRLPISEKSTGVLSLKLEGESLVARYQPVGRDGEPLILNVAVLGVGLSAEISRGENAGKTLSQDFVVLQHRQWRSDNGRWEAQLSPPRPPEGERRALAAWVSRPNRLEPLQAVGGWLEPH